MFFLVEVNKTETEYKVLDSVDGSVQTLNKSKMLEACNLGIGVDGARVYSGNIVTQEIAKTANGFIREHKIIGNVLSLRITHTDVVVYKFYDRITGEILVNRHKMHASSRTVEIVYYGRDIDGSRYCILDEIVDTGKNTFYKYKNGECVGNFTYPKYKSVKGSDGKFESVQLTEPVYDFSIGGTPQRMQNGVAQFYDIKVPFRERR